VAEQIRFDGVSKSYGDVVALDGIDLTIRRGEVHCLVGPNGSGKTTLLDLLLGLERPTAGTVTVPDVPIGCSFQSPTFYPGLTVAENLDVFARLSGCPDEAWRERLVDLFELDRVGDQLAGTLSGGWAKKVDLALGLLKRPTYLLLDEPFGDLDDASKRRLLDFLSGYCEGDRSVLVVTHHVSRFEAIVDRLTVFDGGRIRDDGAVDGTAHDRYLEVLESG